jgi:hypothetical protein
MNRILAFLAFTCCCFDAFAADTVLASLDLGKLGYRLAGPTSAFADYTDIGFLSEDLLLISINQRSFGPVEPLFTDGPGSRIIVFDLKHGRVLTSGTMSVEKMSGSVQPIKGERFAVLSEKGVQFCDTAFQCGPPIQTRGPLLVSPQGTSVAVGGNSLTPQIIVDTESLKQVEVFDRPRKFQEMAIPGEGATLVHADNRITVRRSGTKEVSFHIVDSGTFPEFRFLNSWSLAGLDHDASEVVVLGVDGRQIRRYKVEKAWRTGFLPATSGTRFGIYEHGYTTLNSITNFLDIDDGRPQNFQRVRVIDMSSGNEVYKLEWDPTPHLVKPALSPSGHRIAHVRAGILEVFQVN